MKFSKPIFVKATYHVHGWSKVSLEEDVPEECVYDQLKAIEMGLGYDPGVEHRTCADRWYSDWVFKNKPYLKVKPIRFETKVKIKRYGVRLNQQGQFESLEE